MSSRRNPRFYLDDVLTALQDKDILRAFGDYMNAAPLPSRQREGASDKTIRGYVHDAANFLQWWKQTEGAAFTMEALRRDPYMLNKKVIQDYIAYLERKSAIATVLHKAAALRAFVKFLQASKAIEHDPMLGLRLPRKAEGEPRGLDDKQRARFEAVFQQPWLDRAPKRKRTTEVEARVRENAEHQLVRDRAIVFLMMYAGPRVEEVYQLNVGDVELREKSGAIHIRRGKGWKERKSAIPLPARKRLAEWLEVRKKIGLENVPEAPLFVTLRGEIGNRLSIRAIQNMIAEAGRRAGIKEPVTPHVLRHTCAYMLRRAGVDIETRAKMLGHSIETARKYGEPGESEIEKAASRLDDAEAI
ncbi:MAG: tyrosine-type recombinase/integrase [Chloroflexota bacterium]